MALSSRPLEGEVSEMGPEFHLELASNVRLFSLLVPCCATKNNAGNHSHTP